MPVVSVIIPVFNEAENIARLLDELMVHVPADTEIIFVNDGSTDNTLLHISGVAAANPSIKCISLSRNFGHQNALMAGMNYCSGDYIIHMDGDLQHPPSLIPAMISKLNEGFDIVQTRRITTAGISGGKKFFSAGFYRFINWISDTRIEPNVADFRAFNKKVLDSIRLFRERELFLRGIFSWVGFKTYTLEFNAAAREFGKTKYSTGRMISLALKGATSFSFKPLRVALFIGCMISLAAFGFAIFAFFSWYNGHTVPGWTSMIIAIMFLGGTQLLAIGLLGEYIARLFTESKQRPLYLVERTINIPDRS